MYHDEEIRSAPASFVEPCAARHEVVLRYPSAFRCDLNVHAGAAERQTLAWLRQLGVVCDARAEDRFERLAVGAYGGAPFPRAGLSQLEVITGFLAHWIFYDDVIEGQGEEDEQAVVDALRGEPEVWRGGSPYLRGWWELGQRYRSSMSPHWLHRHAERFRAWLRAVRDEAVLSERFQRQGVLPGLEEYLRHRAVNVGVLPTLDFIEYAMELELDREVLAHPFVQEVEALAARIIGITNDLFAYTKDRRARWPNAVSCAAASSALGPAEAFARVADVHNALVRELVGLEAAFHRTIRERRALARWLVGVHHMIYGLARWHEGAARYAREHELEDGSRVQVVVRT